MRISMLLRLTAILTLTGLLSGCCCVIPIPGPRPRPPQNDRVRPNPPVQPPEPRRI